MRGSLRPRLKGRHGAGGKPATRVAQKELGLKTMAWNEFEYLHLCVERPQGPGGLSDI